MKSKFDFARFGRICLNDIILYNTNILLFFVFLISFNFILHFLFLLKPHLISVQTPLSFLSIIILSILISFSFVEFENAGRRSFFFLYPANISEKYLSRFILTFFGFLIIGVIADIIARYLALLILYRPMYGYNLPMYFGSFVQFFNFVVIYAMAHSVFFFGTVFYKKNSFLKTSISILLIIAFVLVWLKLIHSITIPEAGISFTLLLDKGYLYSSEHPYTQFLKYKDLLAEVILFIVSYILPPVLWVLGFFRLKEEEIADGIQ